MRLNLWIPLLSFDLQCHCRPQPVSSSTPGSPENLLSHTVTVAPGSTPSCGTPALTTFHRTHTPPLTARSTANIQPKNFRCKRSLNMISWKRSGDNCLKPTISRHCPFKLQVYLPHHTSDSHSPEHIDWSLRLQLLTLGTAHLGLVWCLFPAVCGSRETRLNAWHSLVGTTMTLQHLWVQLPWAPVLLKIICKCHCMG